MQRAREELEAKHEQEELNEPKAAKSSDSEDDDSDSDKENHIIEELKEELAEKDKLIKELQAVLLQEKETPLIATPVSLPQTRSGEKGELLSSTLELAKKLEAWYKAIEARL